MLSGEDSEKRGFHITVLWRPQGEPHYLGFCGFSEFIKAFCLLSVSQQDNVISLCAAR